MTDWQPQDCKHRRASYTCRHPENDGDCCCPGCCPIREEMERAASATDNKPGAWENALRDVVQAVPITWRQTGAFHRAACMLGMYIPPKDGKKEGGPILKDPPGSEGA
jgi:hypothetical protein